LPIDLSSEAVAIANADSVEPFVRLNDVSVRGVRYGLSIGARLESGGASFEGSAFRLRELTDYHEAVLVNGAAFKTIVTVPLYPAVPSHRQYVEARMR